MDIWNKKRPGHKRKKSRTKNDLNPENGFVRVQKRYKHISE
jgi:hypothetical protein